MKALPGAFFLLSRMRFWSIVLSSKSDKRDQLATFRKLLKPEDITIVIDTREQLPVDLSPMLMVRGTLATGDYSVRGLENRIAIERKSLQDLIGCIGRERERFDREVQRLLAYETRALFIEGSLDLINAKAYRGEVHPNAVIGSCMGWMAAGLPVMFSGDRTKMIDHMRRFLFIAAQRYYKSTLPFLETMVS